MRLLKRLGRVEAGAAAALAGPGDLRGVGLVWTANDVRVNAAGLVEGEYVACDVHLGADLGGATCVRLVERVTLDAYDFGLVFDADGLRVGRVREVNGSLVRYSVGSPARPAAV